MADIPDGLVLKHHRDLEGLRESLWPRRLLVALVVLFAVLGLANVFGQRPTTAVASAPAAELKVYAPEHLRSGLLFSARFHVYARHNLKDAFLILDPGWAEGLAINTIEPSPVGEASSDGRLSLELGHIASGSSYILFMQFQINPTTVAWRRSADVTLTDGSTPIVRIHRHYTLYP